MRKLTTNEFIVKCAMIHGNVYDYSLVDYKNNKTKVKIICSIHGEFEQTPNCHLDNQGCPYCGREKFKLNKTLSNNKFINKAKNIHNGIFDYSLVEYKKYDEKVKIICSIHGEFEQTPHSHLLGSGCQHCGGVKRKNLYEFIKQAKEKHGDKYDYSLVDYINTKTKVKILCPKHGEFNQLTNNHILGQGCPICKESKGEKVVRNYLISNNLKFIKQKYFNDCKDIRPLPFDFYLPDYNVCIEYDGIQHFKPIDIFGGEKGFNRVKKTDLIKTNYCLNNDIRLIRVNYNEDVNEKLKNEFGY
jgi:hypothetical protein